VSGLEITGLTHRFSHDEPPVLDRIDLAVDEDELLVLLGPSGAGKTTLLRCVAGLERPDAGEIHLAGVDVSRHPPQERGVALVIQGGALLPHMSIAGNLRFPLQARRLPRAEQERRVRAAARMLGLEELLDKRPQELSAGQAQAVSTARQLTRSPCAFLLDEPLARTDRTQRRRLRREIRFLQRGFAAPMVYATNDPEDANAIADRVAVLDRGRLVQVGTPDEILSRPATVTVIQVSSPTPVNLIRARGQVDRRLDVAGVGTVTPVAPLPVEAVRLAVRAEDFGTAVPDQGLELPMTVDRIDYAGAQLVCHGRTDEADPVVAYLDIREGGTMRAGQRVLLHVSTDRVHVFDAATGSAVVHGLALRATP
jgi:ABC-type sugar transport system ATPase subunit